MRASSGARPRPSSRSCSGARTWLASWRRRSGCSGASASGPGSRERELTEIAVALEAVRRGGRRLLLVSGPAGIGKSALLEQLERSVTRPARFAAGKCDQLRGNVPLAPFLEAFGATVADLLAQGP